MSTGWHAWFWSTIEIGKLSTLVDGSFLEGFLVSSQRRPIFKNLNHYLEYKEQTKIFRQFSA